MVHWKEMLGKTARLEGDTLLMYVRPWDYIPCSTAATPQPGRYRVRAMVQARGTGGKPIPMMCVCRDMYGREDTDVRAVRDVPADKPTVIEGEFDLKQREIIVLAGWSLPAARAPAASQRRRRRVADPPSPSRGRLDPWPPAGASALRRRR
jgi:hypothetical protein